MENAGFAGPRIFLSSTSEFDAVCPRILASLQPTYPVWHWKQETALSASAESHCRDMIRNTQVTILLLGNSYGSNYDDKRSICEWEYECAFGPPSVLGILAFVKDGSETTADDRQKKHIAKITNFHQGHWCKTFKNDETLIGQVIVAVQAWHLNYLQQVRASDRRLKHIVFYFLGFALILAGLVLTFVVLGRNGFTPREALVGAISLTGITLAALAAYHLLTR